VSDPGGDPALTLAIALAVGMAAQAVARHLRVPGIVVLLACGVLLGPDGLGIVRPRVLGPALHAIVGYAVAVILFEGGLSLTLERLRREARSIRQLVTVGAVVTAIGAALAARWILDWTWILATLFGTLVMVTGPTVINPLLRRINAHPRVATVLAAEGVLVDAIGAIVAVVALEVLTGPPGHHWAFGIGDIAARLAFGAAAGAVGGALLGWLLRSDRWIPEDLESVFSLAAVLLLYQGANAVMPETGIVSAVVAGVVIGNLHTRVVRDLREFKEQLSTLFVGLLFVLLAADVLLADVQALGGRGVLVVVVLMLVVRPLNVLAGTWRSGLTLREQAFLSWVAPRGIVAAAVSSVFAQRLDEAGVSGGAQLRALVFLVIAFTVVLQGLTAPAVASALGLRRPSADGYVVLGANEIGRALAAAFRDAGERVVLVDSNPAHCEHATAAGFDCVHGSGLDPQVQERLEIDTRAGCIGVTTNEEVNLLFARRARKEHRVPGVWAALQREHLGIDEEALHAAGVRTLFGEAQHLDLWLARLAEGEAEVGWWAAPATASGVPFGGVALPLAVERGGRVVPVDEDGRHPVGGERMLLAVVTAGRDVLRARRWRSGTDAIMSDGTLQTDGAAGG
jgi:NhaP-type Na+/H+ or K+/H+ antiporter